MNKRQFRAIVVMNLLLTIGWIAISFHEEPNLPRELGQYLENKQPHRFTSIDNFFLAVDVVAMASTIGLLFFTRWARERKGGQATF